MQTDIPILTHLGLQAFVKQRYIADTTTTTISCPWAVTLSRHLREFLTGISVKFFEVFGECLVGDLLRNKFSKVGSVRDHRGGCPDCDHSCNRY